MIGKQNEGRKEKQKKESYKQPGKNVTVIIWQGVQMAKYSSQKYNSKIQNMLTQKYNIPSKKLIPFKCKPQGSTNNNQNSAIAPLINVLTQRNAIISWLYHAQKVLKFSRSTLFLGFALLDKLLACGMSLTDSNAELVAGTIALVATKFNEVYPVSVRKLNALSSQHHSLDDYVQFQAEILEMVGFNLSPEYPIYEQLAELENKLGPNSSETIRLAVENPTISFKMGSAVLLGAIDSLFTGGLVERTNESRLSRESAELRVELQKLHSRSSSFKQLVSPTRA